MQSASESFEKDHNFTAIKQTIGTNPFVTDHAGGELHAGTSDFVPILFVRQAAVGPLHENVGT